MKFISLKEQRIAPFFVLSFILACALFMHSCVSPGEQTEESQSEELIFKIGDTPSEEELIAHIEYLKETSKPTSTSVMDISTLDRKQKEIFLTSQERYGNCLPGFAGTDYSRTISVSNAYFSAQVDYTYRYFTNGGVSISSMNVTPNPGFFANNFLLIDAPIDSPYASFFNFYRSFMYAFIASEIDEDVIQQAGVVDESTSGGFIFFNIENKLVNTCWDDPTDGACSVNTWGPTCCQRYSWYWSPDGTEANLGRYYDANGYAVIQGGSSTVVCFGSGSDCGPANYGSYNHCDNSQFGFNSHQ